MTIRTFYECDLCKSGGLIEMAMLKLSPPPGWDPKAYTGNLQTLILGAHFCKQCLSKVGDHLRSMIEGFKP